MLGQIVDFFRKKMKYYLFEICLSADFGTLSDLNLAFSQGA